MAKLKAYDVWWRLSQEHEKARDQLQVRHLAVHGRGRIPGVSKNADMSYAYKDYPTIIKRAGLSPGEGGVKVTETFILDHVGELAFTLLGAAVGFLWKKLMDMVKEQKYLHDGVLAMLHDRLYLICTHYIKMGYIDTDGLDNVGVIYRAYHGLKGNGTGTNLYKRVCALPIKEGDEPLPELP